MPESRYVQMPNGSYLEWPEGVSAEQFKAKAQQFAGIQGVPGATPGMAEPDAVKPAPELKKVSAPGASVMNAGQQLQKVFDQATAPKLHSADQGVMGNIGTGALNVGKGVLSLASPIVHPLETARLGIDLMQNPYGEAAQGIVRPFIEHPAEATEQFAGQMLGTKGLGKVATGVANVTDPIRAYRSPLIPQNEAIARAATDIIKPNPAEYPRMVRNLTQQMPQAKEYLQRAGIKSPSSPLEFGKGATGAGKEASGAFQEQLIAPNAEVPAGGSTIGGIYGEVTDINNKLRPIYRSQTMGEQLTKEAADRMQELEQRRDLLNGVLYKTLSERSGIPVEEIQALNQRGAQLQGIGDVADAAQAVRRMGMNYSPAGGLSKMGVLERVGRAASSVIGGPERIAGWRLGRVMRQAKEPAQALPNPETIANYRQNYQLQAEDAAAANRQASAARKPEGMGPTRYPGQVVYDPVEQQAILRKFEANRQTQAQNAAQRSAAQQAEQARLEANRAASAARKPEGMGPSTRLEPVKESPTPALQERAGRFTERGDVRGSQRAEDFVKAQREQEALRRQQQHEQELLGRARKQQKMARTLRKK